MMISKSKTATSIVLYQHGCFRRNVHLFTVEKRSHFNPRLTACLLLLLLSTIMRTTESSSDIRTERPVIGVVTRTDTVTGEKYIAASYVKWLETVGARSLPILEDANDTAVEAIFQQVNGILLPGGPGKHMTDTVKKIWELAVNTNSNGGHFPLWGTCLGFENIVSVASDSGEAVLSDNFDSHNISLPLFFTEEVEDSKLFKDKAIRKIAETKNVTFNNHEFGIHPDTFRNNAAISSMFKILSLNVDKKGDLFVSSMEARNPGVYPFFGVQWHPEKNNFEYGTFPNSDIPYEDINHDPDAVSVSIEMARTFVQEARKNSHVYSNVGAYPLVWQYELVNGIEFQQRFIINKGNFKGDMTKQDKSYMHLAGSYK